MHDCYITNVSLSEQSLTFELEHGMYIMKGEDFVQTASAKLVFSKLVNLICEIQYLCDSHRECVDLDVLQRDLDNGYVDVIYEMYNDVIAHFEGILIKGSEWKTVEINVFFQEFSIFYEEGRSLSETPFQR
jgi:hypothetical protein